MTIPAICNISFVQVLQAYSPSLLSPPVCHAPVNCIFVETHWQHPKTNVNHVTFKQQIGIPEMLPTSCKSQLLSLLKVYFSGKNLKHTKRTASEGIHQQENRSKSNIKPRILLASTSLFDPLLQQLYRYIGTASYI
ncbi:hypothetical protein JTE90_000257 [Oedothorax gibbosus]|uniref:Uncharacterized protein n=1 Tax=Oedothorax gibbosus TaxID=931172 RepID=A0AAV6VTM2_9ARAC|nr:hypothetical protein JTE90_000257 [Oedothorax gibbosus]